MRNTTRVITNYFCEIADIMTLAKKTKFSIFSVIPETEMR